MTLIVLVKILYNIHSYIMHVQYDYITFIVLCGNLLDCVIAPYYPQLSIDLSIPLDW